jgi:hypothetical protein
VKPSPAGFDIWADTEESTRKERAGPEEGQKREGAQGFINYLIRLVGEVGEG